MKEQIALISDVCRHRSMHYLLGTISPGFPHATPHSMSNTSYFQHLIITPNYTGNPVIAD